MSSRARFMPSYRHRCTHHHVTPDWAKGVDQMRVMIVVHLPQRGRHTGHETPLQKKLCAIYNHVGAEVWEQAAARPLSVMESGGVSWWNVSNEAGLALEVTYAVLRWWLMASTSCPGLTACLSAAVKTHVKALNVLPLLCCAASCVW